MTTDQTLTDILDGTIAALTDLDSVALSTLEQQIVALADSECKFEKNAIGLVLAKKRLLEIVLQTYQVNLDVLTRLHTRSTGNQWAQ